MHALVFETFGGPEVLHLRELPDPVPATSEVLVRTRAIGLNFADIYRRQGHYHLAGDPPWIAGYEAAGEVVSAPAGSEFASADRVAFADSAFANAQLVAVPEDRLIPLPDDIDFETAAALLLQGLTAQYLLRDSHPIRQGETVLVHAGAGGVGQLLVQLAVASGARVLALASTAEKTAVAAAAGAHATATYAEDWWRSRRRLAEMASTSPTIRLAAPCRIRCVRCVTAVKWCFTAWPAAIRNLSIRAC